MDLYDRRQTMEESQSDPQMVWTSQAPETGLEESMWTMGLGSRDSYPERPGEPNCNYYMRTGTCGYGGRCRFNHPRDRSVVVGAIRQVGEYPEREGQPVCEYFLKTGTCKFGASCKYHHPKYGAGSMAPVSLNYFGYPLRPGEKECSYYVKTGQCKFSVTCKFHHPQPAGASVPTPAPTPAPAPAPGFYPSMQSPSVPYPQQYGGSWQPARPALLPGSFMQGPYGSVLLSPGMVPIPTWSPFQAPMSPVASPSAQPTVGGSPLYGLAQLSPSATAYPGPYQPLPPSAVPSSSSQNENMFPERPGMPECPYYMKRGDCKFGPSCKYHHPQDRISPKTNYAPSPMGLPSRPGAPTCTFYMQHGACKYGPACKFDHPMGMLSYSPSASSLADMPVAPYPIGSSFTTLAPSSSSLDLRQEFIAGSNKESLSTRMSSSENTSSGLVGSNFSQSGSVPHSNVQLSGQISTPSRGSSSSTGHGSDIHTST